MPFADAIEHHVRKAEDNLYREEQRLLEMFRNGSRDGEWIKKKTSVDLFIKQGILPPFPKEVLIAITSLHQKGLIVFRNEEDILVTSFGRTCALHEIPRATLEPVNHP